MTSFFSALRHNMSTRKPSSKSSSPSRSPSSDASRIPRQKKVYDFNAYFADQLDDDGHSVDLMTTDAVIDDVNDDDLSCGDDDDDDVNDDNRSVIIDADDSGTIVMTVVHRCQCDRHGDHINGASDDRDLHCQGRLCDSVGVNGADKNRVDFCGQQLSALRLSRD